MTGDKRKSQQGGGKKGSKRGRYTPQKRSGHAIPLSRPGILATCDSGFEIRTAEELCNLIEEHYDTLAKHVDSQQQAAATAKLKQDRSTDAEDGEPNGDGSRAQEQVEPEQPGEGSNKDIGALLAEEVAELKDGSKKRFIIHQTGVRGCIFVCFPEEPALPSPVDVVISVCEEACQKQVLRSRRLNRILPVTASCFASLESMKAMAPKLVQPHFPSGEGEQPIQFAVDYEYRSNSTFDRMQIIDCFADPVPSPPHKVNLGAPEKTVLVQVTRNACGASVVPRYRDLHKFNLKRCAGVSDEQIARSSVGKEAEKKPQARIDAKSQAEKGDVKEAEVKEVQDGAS